MKKRTVIASTLTISTLTAGLSLMNQFAHNILYRQRLDKSNEEDWYSDLGGKKFKIKNHKKLYLQGYLFEEENAKRTIVCLHRLEQSSQTLKETIPYLKKLFPCSNVLLYDAHAHGLSDGYIRGFGYQDVLDLMYFNTYVLQKYGEDHHLVMYGQGVGANTILNASGLGQLKNVDMIISEGAYDNVYHYLSARCQKSLNISHKINAPIIRQFIKKEINKDIKKMNTVTLVKKNQIPTIFVHSKEDGDVPFKHVFSVYNHNASVKMLFPIKEKSLYELIDKTDTYTLSLQEFVNENI